MLEIGSIVEGKVTGLTGFGAFVSLPDGSSGMVHISEVSTSFVKDIKDHLSEGQNVKVKIININDDGKISLSIKKALENQGLVSGWGTWTRTKTNGVRVRCSTIKLFPNGR